MKIEETLQDRGSIYGDFKENASLWASLTFIVEDSPYWERLSPVQQTCIKVILLKVSRIVSGNPNYKDNWHDIAGYAKLAEDRCEQN